VANDLLRETTQHARLNGNTPIPAIARKPLTDAEREARFAFCDEYLGRTKAHG
jgi:hypothetical protein